MEKNKAEVIFRLIETQSKLRKARHTLPYYDSPEFKWVAPGDFMPTKCAEIMSLIITAETAIDKIIEGMQ